jgi:N-acetylmuramoyl-L-alanine amidase
MLVVISSGHGKYVRGATGLIDEVTEARKVVSRVVELFEDANVEVAELHDDVSTNQSDNLHWIVSHHNEYPEADRLDVSIHFNAYVYTESGRGVEVLYLTQEQLAADISEAIAESTGLINRGAQYRSDLYFLNGTTGSRGAVLIECCFVDSTEDVHCYQTYFEEMCRAIVATTMPHTTPEYVRGFGKCSWFGGPDDMGVSSSENLAFHAEGMTPEQRPELFLKHQPEGTTGTARRLDADKAFYFACRFNYDNPLTSKQTLAGPQLGLVRNKQTGKHALASPVDWGPHTSTQRFADLSPALMKHLGLQTDIGEVEIIYPWQE